MSELVQPETGAAAATDSPLGMLWDFWYPAVRSRQLSARALRKATLLEVPLCIGRDRHGKPFALRDICPHR